MYPKGENGFNSHIVRDCAVEDMFSHLQCTLGCGCFLDENLGLSQLGRGLLLHANLHHTFLDNVGPQLFAFGRLARWSLGSGCFLR